MKGERGFAIIFNNVECVTKAADLTITPKKVKRNSTFKKKVGWTSIHNEQETIFLKKGSNFIFSPF